MSMHGLIVFLWILLTQMAGLHSSDKAGPKFPIPSPTFSKSTSAVSEITQPPSYEDAVKQVSARFDLHGRTGWLSACCFIRCGFMHVDSVASPARTSRLSRCSLWRSVVCVDTLYEAERQEAVLASKCPDLVPAATATNTGQEFNFSSVKWRRYLLDKGARWHSIDRIVLTQDTYSNINTWELCWGNCF